MKIYVSFFVLIAAVLLFPAAVSAAAAEPFTLPKTETVTTLNGLAEITQENTNFANGDFFWLRRYKFLKNGKSLFVSKIFIPGEDIRIRAVVRENGKLEWKTDIQTAPYATLFIDTSSYHIIVGVPAVYEELDEYGSLNAVPSQERPVLIEPCEGGYTLTIRFPQNTRYIGEVWALQSANTLVEWDESAQALFLSHDLAFERRFSQKGYYMKSPASYEPTGANMFYLMPAAYTGGVFARTMSSNAVRDLGYVIMKAAVRNQNAQGYYPTLPRSNWLYLDFGIGSGFYDTRFNNDFAQNLIDAYYAYGDPDFLKAVLKYGDFYLTRVQEDSYTTGQGILVADYWWDGTHEKTHVSLNHHVDGMNFLLRLYELTGHVRYRNTARKMLVGIEETCGMWIMDDGNLRYALFYTGSNNNMVDYPYLTYNDLYTARQNVRRVLGFESWVIHRLMESKLKWMLANNVTGYSK